ncbi:MotA/TolQ/ExbB proton channel family protein [Brumimicrobium aurantiacum]|uniref:MotA/TolQ/ExbB proton channel family protein n=1 Tax=Brumimicrobium aurantiacum TaxID=1737063 RepID=A0A3E1EX72_9FLAO|nr:MotA/TolQ/ExbB proton channel family protein [Brumimicrobium aurantiacum]RFC54149.1 MotA/TolQ/ExbB proton channel family protein [Brumimicrobium aurantiacum]
MKKIVSSLAIIGMFTFGFSSVSFADQQEAVNQNEESVELQEEGVEGDSLMNEDAQPETVVEEEPVEETVEAQEEVEVEKGFTSTLKKKFIEGDPFWMGIVLIALIIGIALCIERIVYLNLSSINTKKFLEEVEAAIAKGDIEGAKEICRNTRGPIASIFYQGLARVDEGVEAVEKTVVAYGGVQMGLLEKGVSWISLFIALAPMLGFMGTVIGMIQAFEKIVEDGQVSPITVAGGIQVALLTTVFGLISAIILQIFYNYIVAKVDGIVNEMENSSISLVDMMIKYKVTSK